MAFSPQTSRRTKEPLIVAFYDPDWKENGQRKRDDEGRTLDDILSFSSSEFEYQHDYIQYLFPLPERSDFNPYAPLVTQPIRHAFLSRPELRTELRRSLKHMLYFYGFDMSPAETVAGIKVSPLASEEFTVRAPRSWLTRFNHNHLRITRILRCLRVLGLEQEARAFHQALKDADKSGVVSERTWEFWQRASGRPLHLAPSENDEQAEGVKWLRE